MPTEWWVARGQVWLPAASMACKAPARPEGSAGEMAALSHGAVAEAAQPREASCYYGSLPPGKRSLLTRLRADRGLRA